MTVRWGINNVPKEDVVDCRKVYTTVSGKRVVDLRIQLYNGEGREVTYPVKGTVIEREKPLKVRYAIWTLTGLSDVVWNNRKEDNLKEYKNG